MRRVGTVFILFGALLFSAIPVCPYTLQYTDSSNKFQIKWSTHRINVAFSSSLFEPPANIKAGSDVVGALRRALANWSDAADIEFVESFSKEVSISAAGKRGDGISLITVAPTVENLSQFLGSSDDMSGRTRVFFTRTGNITEADITLNSYQQFSTDGTTGTYDLEATFTHEIGHLLGLEHSSVVGATMQPRQGRNGIYGQPAFAARTLSQDDQSGVRAIYGVRADRAMPRGSVTGGISYMNGAPAFGASVWAEEATTGRVVASSIVLANGTFQIENLLPGKYTLRVEALDGPVDASEIIAKRGAISDLDSRSMVKFRTEELGQVEIVADRNVTLNGRLSEGSPQLNPSIVGFNGQLSTLAVPIVPGRSYTIYAGGDGLSLKRLAARGVSVTSRYLTVVESSITQQQFGGGLSVISFNVIVSEDVPPGDYSIRFISASGETAYLVGGLTVDKEAFLINP